MFRITHLTTVHPRHDTRIFLKQCRSLAADGHRVTLVVADGKGEDERDGVAILDVGSARGRLDRATNAVRRVVKRALALDADIYHLHDPELLQVGLMLKLRGRRVVYDAHEDLPRQILGKPYLRASIRRTVALGAAAFERLACGRLDAVVAATPFIRDKFLAMGICSVDINNYPILGELDRPTDWERKEREVCYVGGISSLRGAQEMVRACALLKSRARLNLAGKFEEESLRHTLSCEDGWSQVNELGFLDRGGVRDVLARSLAGLVTLRPLINYLDALPVKMFEYMAAGLPVIASDFPLWRSIVEGNDCGICVDPLDPSAIAAAIDRLVENPEMARRMGENGQRAVRERYNWANEERKLLALYDDILSGRKAGASPQADAPA